MAKAGLIDHFFLLLTVNQWQYSHRVGITTAALMGKVTIDSDLWDRYVSGDVQAQEKIYKSFFRTLYQYGMKIHPDDQVVKDCIQETMIALYERRNTLSYSPVLHAYLFRALRNKIIDEQRVISRKVNLAPGFSEAETTEEDAEEKLIRSENDQQRRKAVDEAIRSLTGHQRESIYLKFGQGMEYTEIAEVLGVDIASARTLVYRSLKSLKAFISRNTAKRLGN